MTSLARQRLTPAEYLEIERAAEFKSEFFAGEMFAMAGASLAHNLITTNVTRELSTQLKRRPCQVYSSDMRVKVSETGLYTYPDVIIVCGEQQYDSEDRDTLLNPTVLIAGILGFQEKLYFKAEEGARQAPKVDFSK